MKTKTSTTTKAALIAQLDASHSAMLELTGALVPALWPLRDTDSVSAALQAVHAKEVAALVYFQCKPGTTGIHPVVDQYFESRREAIVQIESLDDLDGLAAPDHGAAPAPFDQDGTANQVKE